MKIAILGSTGQTGMQVTAQALEGGYDVTAVVRNPDKMTITHEKLKVKVGDIFSVDAMEELLMGHDVVISCLGFPRTHPVTGYTDSMNVVCDAMKRCFMNRLVVMTSWFTDTSVSNNCVFVIRWLLVPYLRPILENMREMEKNLEKTGINYTVVRPPGLSNKPKTDLPISVSEGEFMVDTGTMFNKTSRADVARFMLSCLSTEYYDRKMLAITTTAKVSDSAS